MPDRSIVLDPANPIPFRVFDNGDGTFSLAIHDPSGVQTRTTHISSAEILDLHNTPVELVPTPGAGKWISTQSVLLRGTHGLTSYVVADNSTVFFVFNDASDSQVDLINNDPLASAVLGAGSNIVRVAGIDSPGNAVNPAFVDNKNLGLLLSAPVTEGDGTLDVTVVYVVVG